MKKQQTINQKTPKSTVNHDIQELNEIWEKTAQELKSSSKQEDQILYSFLEANYIDPYTCLITNKKKHQSHSISCKAKDFRPLN